MASWMEEFGGFNPHPSLTVNADAVDRATVELRARLREAIPSSIRATPVRC
jgi:hypothetical protein